MSERVIEIPRRLIILVVVVIVLVIILMLAISLMSNRENFPNGSDPAETVISLTQISETTTAEVETEIFKMAEVIARDIADGSAYQNTGKYIATESFIAFLDQIAKNMEELGLDPSTTFVRYEGESLATIMTDDFADVSVHVLYRDSALSPDVLYLAEIEVHLVNEGEWKIDGIMIQQKGGVSP